MNKLKRDELAYKYIEGFWGTKDELEEEEQNTFETEMKIFKAGYDAGYAEAQVLLSIMNEALLWADEMLTARDEMNSKVHCAPVRLSPITERVKSALEQYKKENEK